MKWQNKWHFVFRLIGVCTLAGGARARVSTEWCCHCGWWVTPHVWLEWKNVLFFRPWNFIFLIFLEFLAVSCCFPFLCPRFADRVLRSVSQAARSGPVLNFCANNYLGLSSHPTLVKVRSPVMFAEIAFPFFKDLNVFFQDLWNGPWHFRSRKRGSSRDIDFTWLRALLRALHLWNPGTSRVRPMPKEERNKRRRRRRGRVVYFSCQDVHKQLEAIRFVILRYQLKKLLGKSETRREVFLFSWGRDQQIPWHRRHDPFPILLWCECRYFWGSEDLFDFLIFLASLVFWTNRIEVCWSWKAWGLPWAWGCSDLGCVQQPCFQWSIVTDPTCFGLQEKGQVVWFSTV